MDIKRILRSTFITLAIVAAAAAQSAPRQENLVDRINRMNDAEAVGVVNSALDQGVADGWEGDGLYMLAISRSSLVLPIVEERIEELLRSPFPRDRYTNKAEDPRQVVLFLSAVIKYAGNQQALREAGKLIKIDEQRFDRMVEGTLISAITRGNPFTVAYQGLEIGDPAVDKRIIAWAESKLGDDSNPSDGDMKHLWADAMVEKYRAAPTEAEWNKDPIVSRLKPGIAKSLHADVPRLSVEASKKRAK